jgi:hypothetical protein
MSAPLDALVVVPPLSPSDTNPPLGPYILKAAYEAAGLSLEVADLSIAFLNRFKTTARSRQDATLGDQDKDRSVTHAARADFLAKCPLRESDPLHVPCSSDPVLGMHYGFDAIEWAVRESTSPGSFWREFIVDQLGLNHNVPPRIVGISIMGPPQVFVALVVARIVKELWPGVLVVAGGSHITLLIDEISRDPRYGRDIDLFMPGHCEDEFVAVAKSVRAGRAIDQFGVKAGRPKTRPATCTSPLVQVGTSRRAAAPSFRVLPSLDSASLSAYDPARVTLPLQLTRGCSYGRCTYCTYPAVERVVNTEPDWVATIQAIRTLIDRTGVRRVSFKDSLFTTKNLRRLAETLGQERLDITWSATTLLHPSLTSEVLFQLASAGCRTLEVGLETIDPIGQRLFNKEMRLDKIEAVIQSADAAGIVLVLNQIFGWPTQTLESATRQLNWYQRVREAYPQHVRASFNLLEINRASPMAALPGDFGIELRGIAPWAFSFNWNAPNWRPSFQYLLDVVDHVRDVALAA